MTVIRVNVVAEYSVEKDMEEDFAYGLQHNWKVRLAESGPNSLEYWGEVR